MRKFIRRLSGIGKVDIGTGLMMRKLQRWRGTEPAAPIRGRSLTLIIILLVFIVMAAQFESLTYPFIIMFSVPSAVNSVLMASF